MVELSEREQIMVDAITEFIDEHGYCPSRKDLMVEVPPYNSESTTSKLLTSLKAKGVVTWQPGVARSVRLVNER